jgi:hypothetical protein
VINERVVVGDGNPPSLLFSPYLDMQFTMFTVGTKLPIRDVRYPVATERKPEITRKTRFGSV